MQVDHDIAVCAAKLFGGAHAPNRDAYVLDQGFLRDLDKCRKLLPEAHLDRFWPLELGGGGEELARQRVDRKTLFAIGKRVSAESEDMYVAAQLHSCVVFWGAPPGMPMERASRPLREPGAAQKLSEAVRTVHGSGAVSAYNAMAKGGRLAIRGLGPSYFTKLLYFGGYGAKPYMPSPLILDDNVITGLEWLTGQRWHQSGEMYRDYLDLAADLAFELKCEPDVIERRLFDIGERR